MATGWARDLLGLAAVFVFIGLDPNTEFLLGVVDLDQWGAIKTSTTLETNLRGSRHFWFSKVPHLASHRRYTGLHR